MNHVRILGICCLVIGALIFATPTFGFSLIDSDRGANVNVAGDANSFLGITDRSDEGIVIRGNDPAIVLELFDNVGVLGTPEVEIVEYAGTSHPPLITSVLGTHPQWEVEVACDPNAGVRDDATMTFHVLSPGAMSVDLDRVTAFPVETRCGGQIVGESGFSSVTVSDLVFGDASQTQTAEFQLSNDLQTGETVEIEFIQVQIGQRLDYGSATVSSDSLGLLTDSQPGNRYVIEFTALEDIPSGETVVITIDNVDASGNNADGEYDVEFTKEGEEGSRLTTFTVE